MTVPLSSNARLSQNADALKNQEVDFVAERSSMLIDVTSFLEKVLFECLYSFWSFSSMTLLEQSMCFFCGLDVGSQQTILLGALWICRIFPDVWTGATTCTR